MKKFLIVLTIAVAAAWTIRDQFDNANTAENTEVSTPLQELTDVIIPADIPSQIKRYANYTVSFNADTHNPNWVAWILEGTHTTGDIARERSFWTDNEVDGCATTADYKNTGYDRGHMAPAGDMKWNATAMHECFSLANIAPQAHTLNSGSWGKLEEKCRNRAVADSVVVIVCGPVPDETPIAHLGVTGITVPQRYFKVILSPFTCPPMAIGFIMPNGYVEGGMQQCAVSVDSVESVTGYDFFASLPDDIESQVESQCNFPKWSKTKKK